VEAERGAGADAARRLGELRREIAATDEALVRAIAARLRLAREIGALKEELGLPVMDPAREAEVVRRAAGLARDHGADAELVRALLWRIIDAARDAQHGR
jgi:chorismate mutase